MFIKDDKVDVNYLTNNLMKYICWQRTANQKTTQPSTNLQM